MKRLQIALVVVLVLLSGPLHGERWRASEGGGLSGYGGELLRSVVSNFPLINLRLYTVAALKNGRKAYIVYSATYRSSFRSMHAADDASQADASQAGPRARAALTMSGIRLARTRGEPPALPNLARRQTKH